METVDSIDPPLSIGYFSPGWPAEAISNGIATAIGTLTPALKAKGHRVTIITVRVAEGTRDDSVYELARSLRPPNAARRALVRLGYRVAFRATQAYVGRRAILELVRRAQAERGMQIFEMEESFGTARWVSRRISIPLCVRVHGPWFLNGPAQGCPQDETFRRRVIAEGRAIRDAQAITAPSHDVLDRVRDFYGLALPDAEVIPGTTPAVPADQRWRWDACDPKAILFVGRFDRHKGGPDHRSVRPGAPRDPRGAALVRRGGRGLCGRRRPGVEDRGLHPRWTPGRTGGGPHPLAGIPAVGGGQPTPTPGHGHRHLLAVRDLLLGDG